MSSVTYVFCNFRPDFQILGSFRWLVCLWQVAFCLTFFLAMESGSQSEAQNFKVCVVVGSRAGRTEQIPKHRNELLIGLLIGLSFRFCFRIRQSDFQKILRDRVKSGIGRYWKRSTPASDSDSRHAYYSAKDSDFLFQQVISAPLRLRSQRKPSLSSFY